MEYDTLYHLVLNKIRECAKAALTDGEAIAGKLTNTCEAEQKGQRDVYKRQGDAMLPLRWLRQLPFCGLAARKHLALQDVPVRQVLQNPAIHFRINEI